MTLRCGEENNDYRHGEMGFFTGKINHQFTIERKYWIPSGKGMEIKMQSHNVPFGY
jgi:hypothetical protein